MSELIDYSNSFEHTLIAQGQGKYFISIERLNKPYKRNDGRLGKYLINFRSLSQEYRASTSLTDPASISLAG